MSFKNTTIKDMTQSGFKAPSKRSSSSASEPMPTTLGGRLKSLRLSRGLSLRTLADLSGVSPATLSQIERDIANPSLRVLTKLQNVMDGTLGDLFPKVDRNPADPDFVRRQDRRPFCDLGTLSKELLSTSTSKNLEMMILHIPPGGSTGDAALSTLADKAGLVLAGEVKLQVQGRIVILNEGDSFQFDGAAPHYVFNKAAAPAKVLWIVSRLPLDRLL